jgi:predicted DNA-binding transcriptional regulator AlpA
VKSPDSSDRWLSERETARLIGMSRAWLQRERATGKGIPYVKVRHAVRYRLSDIIGWMEARKRSARERHG